MLPVHREASFPKTINPPAGGNYFQTSVKNVLKPFVKNLTLTGAGRYGVPKKPLWERSGSLPKFGFAQKPKSTRRGELLFGRLGFASRIPWSPPPGGNGSPKILGSVPKFASGPVRVYARGPRVRFFPVPGRERAYIYRLVHGCVEDAVPWSGTNFAPRNLALPRKLRGETFYRRDGYALAVRESRC